MLIEEYAIYEVNDDIVGKVSKDREHLCQEFYDDYRKF